MNAAETETTHVEAAGIEYDAIVDLDIPDPHEVAAEVNASP